MRSIRLYQRTKIGLISLYLTALVGCTKPTVINKPQPLLCPMVQVCQKPPVNVKTNGDLVQALDEALSEITLCQVQIDSLEKCIDGHNSAITE
ncbi:Rz1-like lysis system protein LysC [Glaesserella parasuis]|uniref:Rz1-like lysis system protein LysC n=1 Tax=Glaesserella parasuis TaxID=738 RepID=UPI00385331F8|nr:Rz1-like lysis system protein LysC [Glaesserella parasuis]MCT8834552.1 Rz1-like lysis system protein LysC [Glaesserella parasuis]